jgi:hypothetical protein
MFGYRMAEPTSSVSASVFNKLPCRQAQPCKFSPNQLIRKWLSKKPLPEDPSGMRLLRRLEKNHDGIRSAATRQHYIQIYQAMKYLSLDVADFIEKGPQLAELPDV